MALSRQFSRESKGPSAFGAPDGLLFFDVSTPTDTAGAQSAVGHGATSPFGGGALSHGAERTTLPPALQHRSRSLKVACSNPRPESAADFNAQLALE